MRTRSKALHKVRPEYKRCFTSSSELPRAKSLHMYKVSSAKMILTYILVTYTYTQNLLWQEGVKDHTKWVRIFIHIIYKLAILLRSKFMNTETYQKIKLFASIFKQKLKIKLGIYWFMLDFEYYLNPFTSVLVSSQWLSLVSTANSSKHKMSFLNCCFLENYFCSYYSSLTFSKHPASFVILKYYVILKC